MRCVGLDRNELYGGPTARSSQLFVSYLALQHGLLRTIALQYNSPRCPAPLQYNQLFQMLQVIFTSGREVVQYLAHMRLPKQGLHAMDPSHPAQAVLSEPDRLEHEQLVVLQHVVVSGGRLLRLCR